MEKLWNICEKKETLLSTPGVFLWGKGPLLVTLKGPDGQHRRHVRLRPTNLEEGTGDL